MTTESESVTQLTSNASARHAVHGVIVTHHGSGEMLQRCLDSTFHGIDNLVVVDNSGRPGYESRVGAERIETIRVENRGYGAAVNEGLKHLRDSFGVDDAHLIAVLNDDVEADTDWLDPLVGAFESDPSIGAVQPKLLLTGTDPAQVNSVGVELDRSGAGTDTGYREIDGPEWEAIRSIEIFTAGAVVFRAEFLQDLGGFDERYFLYYEDVDQSVGGVTCANPRVLSGMRLDRRRPQWVMIVGIYRSETGSGSPAVSGLQRAWAVRCGLPSADYDTLHVRLTPRLSPPDWPDYPGRSLPGFEL